MANQLVVGSDVIAKDGRKIGLLNRVRGDYIRVQGADDPFWLPADVVQFTDPVGVRLSVPSDGIEEHRVMEDDLPPELETESPINPSQPADQR